MSADVVVVVVVHAEEVDRLGDRLQVAVVHERLEPMLAQVVEHVGRVGAEQQRLEVHPVPEPVDAARGVEVDGVARVVRHGRGEVERDAEAQAVQPPGVAPSADRCDGRSLADGVGGEAVRQVLVVQGGQCGIGLAAARCVLARGVADEGGAQRLVERRPVVDPVAERVVDCHGVVAEAVGRVAVRPASFLLQRLRQVPVVERQPREDARAEQLVDEAAVEVESGRVHRAVAGNDARPGGREAVRLEAEGGHQRDVLRHAVVVVDGAFRGVAAGDRVRHPGEGVPDGVLLAVLVGGALDLRGGGGGAPQEAVGPTVVGHS